MNNLLIASLAITLGGHERVGWASAPMEQSPSVPTPPAVVHKENAEADNGAGPNSSARVTEQKSVGGVPVLISRPGVVNPSTRLVLFYHGFGPPQNPRALAEVLRLEEMDAILAFVNLPMVADRIPSRRQRRIVARAK